MRVATPAGRTYVRRMCPRTSALLCLLATGACASGSRGEPPPVHPSTLGLTLEEARVLEYDTAAVPEEVRRVEVQIHQAVNAFRTRFGLTPVEHDAALARIARIHSRAMAAGLRPVGHAGMERRARLLEETMPYWLVGENVFHVHGFRANVAPLALRGWTLSPPHRETMEGRFSHTGVGVARSPDGAVYVTQIFLLAR